MTANPRRTFGRRSIALGAVLAVATSGCGSGAGNGNGGRNATSKLSVPAGSVSASQGAIQYTVAKGYFAKNGLTVTTPLSSEGPLKAAIVAGSVPFAQLAGGDVLTLHAKKVGIKTIACVAPRTGYYLYAGSGISRLSAVRGRTVGVPSLGGAPQIAMQNYLTTKGLSPDSVKFVALGSIPNVLAALTGHKIDAGLLSTPFNFKAKAAGLRELGYATGPPTPYIVNSAWAEQHRSLVAKILKSLVEGTWAYQTKESDAVGVLARFLRLDASDPGDRTTLRRSFEAYLPPVQAPPGRCRAADFTPFLRYLPSSERPERAGLDGLFDNSYVEKLSRSGFYSAIQRKYGPLPKNTTMAQVLR